VAAQDEDGEPPSHGSLNPESHGFGDSLQDLDGPRRPLVRARMANIANECQFAFR
jgi:hypothetical protein